MEINVAMQMMASPMMAGTFFFNRFQMIADGETDELLMINHS